VAKISKRAPLENGVPVGIAVDTASARCSTRQVKQAPRWPCSVWAVGLAVIHPAAVDGRGPAIIRALTQP